MEERQEPGKTAEGEERVEKAARVSNEVDGQPKKRKTKTNPNPAIDLVDCRTCGTKTKSWGFLKQHVVNVHLANRAEVYFSCQGDSYGCEYGQDCGYIAKSKQSVRMHLCNVHHVVSEQEIIEVATNFKQLVHTEAEDGSRKETVVSLVRRHSQENLSYSGAQDCKVRLTNILQEPDERATVLDISNYEVIRTSPNSLGTVVGQNTMNTAPESEKLTCTPTSAKRKLSRTKLDPGPALFTSPEIVKKLTTPMKTSLTKPETSQSSPNIDPCKSVPHQNREKSKKCYTSDEKEQSKGGLDEKIADKHAKYTCKWCFHKYTDTPDLKKHLLETHRDKFARLHLLEAGEKFYECSLGCQPCFKHKSKEYYMKHLKKVHNEVVLELVELEDAWRELLDWRQFCSRQADDSLEHLGQPWVPPPIKQRTRVQPELVVIEDEEVVQETGTGEMAPKTAQEVVTEPEEVVTLEKVVPAVVGLDVRMEEEAATTEGSVVQEVMPEKKEVMRKRSCIENETSEVETSSRHKEENFVCQVCDQSFTAGGEVSLHMFQCHLRGLSSVWTPLVGRAPSSAWPHSWLCLLCDNTFLSRKLAQLHIYTESAHKRRLKKSMEERAENWQHTLEFVRYKLAAEMLEESDSDEGSGGELASEEVVTDKELGSGDVITGGELVRGDVITDMELGNEEVVTGGKLASAEVITGGDVGSEDTITGGELVGGEALAARVLDSEKVVTAGVLGSGEAVTAAVLDSREVVTSSTAEPTFSRQKLWAEAFGAEEPLDYEPEEPDDETDEPEEPEQHEETDPHLEDGEIKDAAAASSPLPESSKSDAKLQKVKKEAASKDAKKDPQVTECPTQNQVRGPSGVKSHRPVDGDRVDRTATPQQELPCSHTRSGCSRVLTCRPSLHKHARACSFRPRESWPCDVYGCGKRYYYEDDYVAHRQKCLNMQYFQCQDCEYNAVTSREIISHKMESHLQRLQ